MMESIQVRPFNTQKLKAELPALNITLKEFFTLLIGTAIPVAIGIYTSVTNERMQRSAQEVAKEQQRIASERIQFDRDRAEDLYQQELYQTFLDDFYELQKDGELSNKAKPWIFANARYRAAHRVFDEIRKAQALQFLKEKDLIGRQKCNTGCDTDNTTDVIRLIGLNFDHINLTSSTNGVSKLNLACIQFDYVSMVNVTFSHVNLNGVQFIRSQLRGTIIKDSFLTCTKFFGTSIDEVRFENSPIDSIQIMENNFPLNPSISNVDQEIFCDSVSAAWGTQPVLQNMPVIFKKSSTIEDITVAGGMGQGNELSQLSDPYGLYVDENQTIYVADHSNHRIVEWKVNAQSSKVVAGGNGQGSESHQLSKPVDVIVDKKTNSFVICDRGNKRIVRWPRDSKMSSETIIADVDCSSLTTDENGSLYVVDAENHEVRRYEEKQSVATVVAGGNGQGDNLNQLHGPSYIFVDQDHSVYVSECGSHRVTKWIKGAQQGIVVAGGQKHDNNRTQLMIPTGVVVDQWGTVYVADMSSGRVLRWPKGTTEGYVILGDNALGQQPNALKWPEDLSFDKYGYLYVVDRGNSRIQKFNIFSIL